MRKIIRLFSDTYRHAEAHAEDFRHLNKNRADWKIIFILCYTAFAMTMNKYLSDPYYCYKVLGSLADDVSNTGLLELGWWVAVLTFFYLIVPVLVIKFAFREKISDYGFRFKGTFKDYYLYLIMLVVMVPLVLYFSGTKSFQARYPFYHPGKCEPLFPAFAEWEIMYFIQFFALEFFFRGFMVHGTKNRFGYYSVFVMTIPYCMIHFGKPLQETIAAIIAGIVLGTVSLKSRSIWLGIAIHYTVAISMDLAALWQKGFF